MARAKVGLALGGGFARGIAHIGVIQALVSHNIPIDLVAGTSAGSLIGAMFCAGLDPWLLERIWQKANWREMVRLRLRRDGLLDAQGLERFVMEQMGDLQFRELALPFTAVATDLTSGEEMLLDTGRVSTALRASCAFPGIFLPVRVGKHTLVDGGLRHPVPASVVRRMGADLVIAVELGKHRATLTNPRNLIHIMMYSLALIERPHIEQSLAAADLIIQPNLADFGLVELERVSDMVRVGRESAEAVIGQVQQAIEDWAVLHDEESAQQRS